MGITYSSFLKLNISLAPLGIAWDESAAAYFCTPKGARIIGWAGFLIFSVSFWPAKAAMR